MSHDSLFYGKPILRDREQDHIRSVLEKYRHEPVTDALKKKIYDELCREKLLGHISIPFKLIVKTDPEGHHPDCIEVLLDTRV